MGWLNCFAFSSSVYEALAVDSALFFLFVCFSLFSGQPLVGVLFNWIFYLFIFFKFLEVLCERLVLISMLCLFLTVVYPAAGGINFELELTFIFFSFTNS